MPAPVSMCLSAYRCDLLLRKKGACVVWIHWWAIWRIFEWSFLWTINRSLFRTFVLGHQMMLFRITYLFGSNIQLCFVFISFYYQLLKIDFLHSKRMTLHCYFSYHFTYITLNHLLKTWLLFYSFIICGGSYRREKSYLQGHWYHHNTSRWNKILLDFLSTFHWEICS